MRPHRRTRPLDHVLVAGDVGEIHAIQRLLRLLPAETYGQVYIETFDARPDAKRPTLQAPARVAVTWLAAREPHRPVGARAASAVHGWLAEWQPGDPQPGREFTLWVGRSAAEHLDDARLALARLEHGAGPFG